MEISRTRSVEIAWLDWMSGFQPAAKSIGTGKKFHDGKFCYARFTAMSNFTILPMTVATAEALAHMGRAEIGLSPSFLLGI